MMLMRVASVKAADSVAVSAAVRVAAEVQISFCGNTPRKG